MVLPKRKSNRLKQYNYNQPGMYFVTICAKDRQPIFGSVVGGGALDAPKTALSPVGKVVEQYILTANNAARVLVKTHVIMPNHVHLLFEVLKQDGTSKAPSPTNAVIPHTVATLKRFVNQTLGENVFQRSFHDRIVRNEKEYQKIFEYIQTNPAKWQEDCFFINP